MESSQTAGEELLRRFGRDVSSFAAGRSGLERLALAGQGLVAWREVGGALVAAGGPIASADAASMVLGGFVERARADGKRPILFGVEGDVTALDPELTQLKIGEQAVWDPVRWPTVLRSRRSLREQLRRARAKGVQVRAVSPSSLGPETELRADIEALIERWLLSRRMAPLGFVVHVEPFERIEERRVFVAERVSEVGAELVGVVLAVPIYARDGWFLQDVLRDPSAPNGTVELLFDAAMRDFAAAGSRFVTLGLAPLAGVEARWLRFVRRVSRPLYDFEGLLRFKAKLHPDEWQPVHVAHLRQTSSVRAVLDVLAAFAGRHGFVGFGLRTSVHRASLIVRLLALMLVPWMVVLASADPRWFPSRGVQMAWLGYDAMLGVLLWRLAGRWQPRHVDRLCVLIGIDFVCGLLQLALHGRHQVRTPVDGFVLFVALAAPLGALALLRAARDPRVALARARAAGDIRPTSRCRKGPPDSNRVS